MAQGLCPAGGARSDAQCFLSHLSEVPSPWSLACCWISAGQGGPTARAAVEAALQNVPGHV